MATDIARRGTESFLADRDSLLPGPSLVTINGGTENLYVAGRLVRAPSSAFVQPRYTTVQRPGAADFQRYDGRGNYVQTVRLRFDGLRSQRSVEPELADLERLGERRAGSLQPPTVKLAGSVTHPNLTWVLTGIEEVDDEPDTTYYLPDGSRCRCTVDVTFTEYVAAPGLTASLKATKKTKGIASRTTTVKAGEDSFADVARRVYRDSSRASEIARANGMPIGKHLKKGLELRYP